MSRRAASFAPAQLGAALCVQASVGLYREKRLEAVSQNVALEAAPPRRAGRRRRSAAQSPLLEVVAPLACGVREITIIIIIVLEL